MPVVVAVAASWGAAAGATLLGTGAFAATVGYTAAAAIGGAIGGAIAGGLAGGVSSSLMGGDFGDGFRSGAIGGALGGALMGFGAAGGWGQLGEAMGFGGDAGSAAVGAEAGTAATGDVMSSLGEASMMPGEVAAESFNYTDPSIFGSEAVTAVEPTSLGLETSMGTNWGMTPQPNLPQAQGLESSLFGSSPDPSMAGQGLEGVGTFNPGGLEGVAADVPVDAATSATRGGFQLSSLKDLMPTSQQGDMMRYGFAGAQTLQDMQQAKQLKRMADQAAIPYNKYMSTFENPDQYFDEYMGGQGAEMMNKQSRLMAKSGRTGALPALWTQAHQNYTADYLPTVRQGLATGAGLASTNMQQQGYPLMMQRQAMSNIPNAWATNNSRSYNLRTMFPNKKG